MPRFRARITANASPVADPRPLLGDIFRPCHFYIGRGLSATWHDAVKETIPWEIYQGRLLDAAQTRERRSFEAWNLVVQTFDGPAPLPLVILKWEELSRAFLGVLGLLCQ